MKAGRITPTELASSVIAVPPLARDTNDDLSRRENVRLIEHLAVGGVTTLLYGGNANVYNIANDQYASLFGNLPSWVAEDTWVIPSIGPSYGQMLDHVRMLEGLGYPTVMILPMSGPATRDGTATGIRRAVEAFGKPVIVYLKSEEYLSPRHVADLVDDGLVCGIKYAIVRDDPAVDDFLGELVDRVDRQLVISGIGERPAVVHWKNYGLSAFTSGSACVAPRQSTQLLSLLRRRDFGAAESMRHRFLPLEDLRDSIHPIRVLHDAVTLADIADMGPILPLLSNTSEPESTAIERAARTLLKFETSMTR